MAALQPGSQAAHWGPDPQTAKATGGSLCSRTCPALGSLTTPPETAILPCSTWVSPTFEKQIASGFCVCLLLRWGLALVWRKLQDALVGLTQARASLGKVRQANGMNPLFQCHEPALLLCPCGTPASWLTLPSSAHSRLVPHPARPLQRADLWSKHNISTAAVIYVALKHLALKSHTTYLFLPSPLLAVNS